MIEFGESDWRAAVYVASDVIRQRQLSGAPIPDWLRRHQFRCEQRLLMSRARQQFGGVVRKSEQDELIGVPEAGTILGWKPRRVQRNAADLGGQLVGSALVFRRSVVEDFANERTA